MAGPKKRKRENHRDHRHLKASAAKFTCFFKARVLQQVQCILKKNEIFMLTTEPTVKKEIQFVHGGKELFDVFEQLIRDAKNIIHLQTYIFDDDETGSRIANALMEAAGRGVQVFVLVDGYASQGLP